MKIRSVELIPVTLPYNQPVSDAWGRYEYAKCAIVKVTDEDGLCGYGEVSLAWFGGVHHMCREAMEIWVPRLKGIETSDITKLNQALDSLSTFSKRHLLVKAGIEMAVWDLLGKELHVPVYKLLGGKVRERIPLTGGIAMLSVSEMREQAVKAVQSGFKELKIKVGLEKEKDLEAVAAIRDAAGPGIRLRADANMAWPDAKTAKYMMDAFYEYGVELIEQPLDYRDLDGLRWLRRNTPCRILIDEGIWDLKDAAQYIRSDAVDILHIYVCEAGGIQTAQKIFCLAEANGKECTIGSMPEGLVGASAAMHVAAAMPNLSVYPSDLRGFTVFAEDVAVTDMHIENGELTIPDKEGLGFEIDEKQLLKLSVR